MIGTALLSAGLSATIVGTGFLPKGIQHKKEMQQRELQLEQSKLTDEDKMLYAKFFELSDKIDEVCRDSKYENAKEWHSELDTPSDKERIDRKNKIIERNRFIDMNIIKPLEENPYYSGALAGAGLALSGLSVLMTAAALKKYYNGGDKNPVNTESV